MEEEDVPTLDALHQTQGNVDKRVFVADEDAEVWQGDDAVRGLAEELNTLAKENWEGDLKRFVLRH